MGLLSSSVSITRYKVVGKIKEPILETIAAGLRKYEIPEPADECADKISGWTSFDSPYKPDFESSSFVIGTHVVFCLRVDKKTIPPKLIKKHCAIESAKRLAETGQEFLSRNAKKDIKSHVINVLTLRLPAIPNIYDIVWNYEDSEVLFFSNLSSANEELETLFSKSFDLSLVRLFPYTIAELVSLSDKERDVLPTLAPTNFSE